MLWLNVKSTAEQGLIFDIKNTKQFNTFLQTYDHLLVYTYPDANSANKIKQINILEEIILDDYFTSLPLKIIMINTNNRELKKLINRYTNTKNSSLIFFYNGRMANRISFTENIERQELHNFIEQSIDETEKITYKKKISKRPHHKRIIVEKYSDESCNQCSYSYPRFGASIGFGSPYYYDSMWPGYWYNRPYYPSWYGGGFGFAFRGGWSGRHGFHGSRWHHR